MKGVMHTIEAVIAIAIITAAVIGLFRPMQAADNSAQLVSSGYDALQYLEDTGELRPDLAAQDTDAIRAALRPLLVNFELEICDPQCIGTAQPGAAALDYFIAGDGSYMPVHMKLYVW